MTKPSKPDTAKDAAGSQSAFSLWLARLALLAVVGLLGARGVLGQTSGPEVDTTGWESAPALHLRHAVRHLAVEGAIEAALFFAVGLFVPLALGRYPTGRFARGIVVLVLGIGITIGIRCVELVGVPSGAHLVLPLIAYVFGAWIGSAWRRGMRAFLWLIPQLGVLLLLLAAGVFGLAWLAIENDPLPIEPLEITTAHRRHLAEIVRGARDADDSARRVVFTEAEVNQLLAATIPRFSPNSRAHVEIAGSDVEGELALALPHRLAQQAYANVQVVGNVRVADGDLTVELDSAHVGRLGVPPAVLRFVAPLLAATIRGDRELGQVIDAIQSLEIKDNSIETKFKPGEFDTKVVPALARKLSGKAEVIEQTQDQVRHLVAAARDLPAGDARLPALIEQAFRLARERSAESDPVLENRAALLALAILLGHERVESLVGEVTDETLREQARRELGGITLRDRTDWTRHFFVSAAIALVSNEQTSDAVGVLKETLDAEKGGSGFSFGDLCADRAGTRFALAATRDAASARKMQERIAAGVKIDDLFPPAADLPEGLSADEFQSKYGGVDGPGYQQIVEEIDGRLAHCALLE